MVTICQQCGDKGWSVALIYCSRCINFAVHRYCFPKIPPTFDEFVSWACEDCERRTSKNKSLNHVDLIDCETERNTIQEDLCLDAEKIEEIDEKIQGFPSPWQFPEAPATPIEPEVKIMNDAVDSETNMDENKASQTPNSAKKMRKKRRKTVTCGTRKRKKIVNPVAKKQEEPEQVDPTEHAELAQITKENKNSQTPNSTKKMAKRRRKTVTCGTRKRRKVVNLTAEKHEEPVEMDPTEHAELAKITNDAIESETSQTPNSATEKSKRKRKTVTCGTRKRRRVVLMTKP